MKQALVKVRRHLEHSQFKIGAVFWCGGRQWRCTDIGTRTIVAIRVDRVEVESSDGSKRLLDSATAESEGWFRGPPYPVAEIVFDEDDVESCSLEPEEAD